MARASTKEYKNIYHKTRESLQLSREAASELLKALRPNASKKSKMSALYPILTKC